MPDAADMKILAHLQDNCRRPIAEIAEAIGMSLSACARRINLLEERGFIYGYGARLDPAKLGLNMTFFVEVSLDSQAETALSAFENAAIRQPEVLECHLMTGRFDYLIKMAAKDTADFEHTHRRVISKLPHVAHIQSSLVIKTVKPWAGYPTI